MGEGHFMNVYEQKSKQCFINWKQCIWDKIYYYWLEVGWNHSEILSCKKFKDTFKGKTSKKTIFIYDIISIFFFFSKKSLFMTPILKKITTSHLPVPTSSHPLQIKEGKRQRNKTKQKKNPKQSSTLPRGKGNLHWIHWLGIRAP
jgi:hypothetical protein